jgi:hypothetical protein
MDEISMFAELRPAPPADADADAIRAAVRGRLTSVLSEADPAAHGRRRSPVRPRVLIGGGLVAAATVAAITVPVWLPGAGNSVLAKAWAVERNNDGTVTIKVSQQFNDPAGLQRALTADGITAIVTLHREITGENAGGGYSYDECDYLHLDYAPQAVQDAVVAEGKNTVSSPPSVFDDYPTFVLHPAAMPAGSALLIAAWRSSDGISLGVMEPTVLRTDKPPVCTPTPKPMLGPAPGVVPGQPPSGQATMPAEQASAAASPYPSTPAAG